MDKMMEAAVTAGVFFIFLSAFIIPNFQSAQDATSDSDVSTLIYLVLVLFLVAAGLGTYKKMT